MGRYIYHFAPGEADGPGDLHGTQSSELLGVRGSGLAVMARLGLRVPPGMTVSAEACHHYLARRSLPTELLGEIEEGISRLEEFSGRGWGSRHDPLLVSLRSDGALNLPGKADSIFYLGLNEDTIEGLIDQSQNEVFALDCWRQMIQMYAVVVYGVEESVMESLVEAAMSRADVASTVELDASDWRRVIKEMKRTLLEEQGEVIPHDPLEQVWAALGAVFEGWNSPQSVAYRRLQQVGDGVGTAVSIMTSVFGNLDDRSASGIAFTRNPVTGAPKAYGEYLARTGNESEDSEGMEVLRQMESVEETMPAVYVELCGNLDRLEAHYRDMLEIEFVVESGRLWILQSRRAQRSGRRALRAALDLMQEGVIDAEEAVMRVDPDRHVPELLGPRIDPALDRPPALLRGRPASPGAAVGRLVTTTAEAVARARRGEKVVLLRHHTSPSDLGALGKAQAVVTSAGGLTSHGATVSRSMGIPCVSGARELRIAPDGSGAFVGDHFIARGEPLTVDGTRGEVFIDQMPLVEGGDDERFQRFLELCDRQRRLEIRVNADTLEEARRGIDLGAEGIGLCRTERMILAEPDRLMAMRRAILAGEEEGESAGALQELLAFHRHDIAQLLRMMAGRPVTMRLLDPPLSHFLPDDEASIHQTALALEMEMEEVARRVESLRESNPMMGLRGCRLGVVHPSIYAMQVQAIVEAARMVIDAGVRPVVEILIPLVADVEELRRVVRDINQTIGAHLHGTHQALSLEIGAMIEIPRAALQAEEIANCVDFFCIGTNDLTQMSWGMSGEDSRRFMSTYLDEQILSHDPFLTLDRPGVGELIRIAVHRGRRHNSELFVGVCGAHAGDFSSVRFFESQDIDYITVEPSQVPKARVAAARAYIAYERALAASRVQAE